MNRLVQQTSTNRERTETVTGVAAAQTPVVCKVEELCQREIMPSASADSLIARNTGSFNARENNFSGNEMGRNVGESLNKLR